MANALILGGAGFIGFHLTQDLVRSNLDEVTLVDNFSRGKLDEEMAELLEASPNIRVVTADLTRSDWYRNLKGPYDQVYLLAGIVGVGNVQADPVLVLRTNTLIILNTLDWLKKVGCGRLLFASSSETYAGGVHLGITQVPTAEDAPVVIADVQNPRSTYAITKLMGESAVIQYARTFGFESVVLRYHNVYGPRMGFNHVIPELFQRISQRMDPLPVYGLEQTRAFCYITDAVKATQALMNCKLDSCEIVHVGNDQEEIPISGLLAKILDITGFHPDIKSLPAPSASIHRRCPDITRLRALTSVEPEVDIDHGLALTFDWHCRTQGPLAISHN